MDDISRYIETANRLQDAINLPAIRAIQDKMPQFKMHWAYLPV